ncbi:MAG: SDR family NAD(P)-dependent oxidoreductase [Alphaproteobacteria bacterium]|nr:SDR family NAD(P)-dependent oxidoreductase [Alphaproteobacteria bacterium]
MTENDAKVWFITGGSAGIGQSMALELLERGQYVATTARDAARLDPRIAAAERGLALSLEVSDADQCRRAVDAILAKFGRIDVLINNAGHGMMGAVEEVSDAEARKVFDSNVFGLLNVTRAVLPFMRASRSGHVVNIGSVGGLLARAGMGIYAATKFALEGISEAMYHELKPLGIGVTVVEPGPFRTEFAGRSLHEAAHNFDDYLETAGAWRKQLRKNHGTQQGDPDKAAKVIIEATLDAKPPLHLVLGNPAMERAGEKLRDLLNEMMLWQERSAATDFD